MADNRRMCSNCRAFITTSNRTCPYCEQPVGQRAIDVRQPGDVLGGLIPHAQFTTVMILLINTALFAGTYAIGNNVGEGVALWALGAKFGPSMWGGNEWWRLITAGFLHGGLIHIAVNSWSLYGLGAQVEQLFGTARYLVIYFLATAAGFFLSAWMKPGQDGMSVGSSAGIAGLVGAMIAFGFINRSTVGRAIRNFYLQSLVYLLVIGLMGFRIDNWAHLGGVGAGFIIGFLGGTPVRSNHPKEAAWRATAGVCMAITLFCFWQVYVHFPTPAGFDQLR